LNLCRNTLSLPSDFQEPKAIMQKKFNITGICRPAKHYMADVSDKLAQTLAMVEDGDYFIINRPRQYGKTTTLYTLSELLEKKGSYLVFNISFEGVGSRFFEEEQVFCRGFIRLLADYARYRAPELFDWLDENALQKNNIHELSDFITQLANKTEKKIVLLIDEVDKSSNNQLFIDFLAMLRNKYLTQDLAKTLHAVVLAGLHDIKSLKLKLRPDSEQKYNSPWNIAAEFTVDMNLQPSEIVPMLEEYARDKQLTLDPKLIAERLFYYTSGYPFLVSKLCKIIDEQLLPQKTELSWALEDVETAFQQLTRETNTNFESLAKNLENSPELYQLVYKVAIDGEAISYNPLDPTINFAFLYGIFVNQKGILKIHNLVYQEVLLGYMASRMHLLQLSRNVDFGGRFINADRSLNLEAILLKFQAFMREQDSDKDRDFLERNGRLVFLAFLKPIINGSGFDFKEPQISEERRLDVVITYLQHKYIAELKIWRGPEAHAEGLAQLADYLDRQALHEGYLLVFDHSKKKSWKSGWEEVLGKKVFVVWV
jgi:hypothetical protein